MFSLLWCVGGRDGGGLSLWKTIKKKQYWVYVLTNSIESSLWFALQLFTSLQFFLSFFLLLFCSYSVTWLFCSQGAQLPKCLFDEWTLKSAHHTGKNQTERKIQCRVKSILICKSNQYGTCQGGYEVNWTKKKKISFILRLQGNCEGQSQSKMDREIKYGDGKKRKGNGGWGKNPEVKQEGGRDRV